MIVVVYPQLSGVGGIARYIESWLANISDGNEKMLVIHGGSEVRLKARADVVELKYIPMPEGRLGLAIWTLRVRKLLRSLQNQGLVSAINFHAPPLIPAFSIPGGIPLTVTAHTTYYGMSGRLLGLPLFPSSWSRLSVKIKMAMERWLFQRASKIITLTEQGRSEVLHYGYRGTIKVIPNGVDLSQFSRDLDDITKDIDVVFPGRIEPRKGSLVLPLIIERLIAIHPSIRIAVVGYGEGQAGVEAVAQRYPDNVIFTGQVPFAEMVGWLKRSKIYAAPSFYEGLPGTCVEAMAMSLPVVVWDMQFYDGLVENAQNGIRVKPGDVGEFAAVAIDLLRSGRIEAMGEAAHHRATTAYSWFMLADQITSAITDNEKDLQVVVTSKRLAE
ncbi:glycosyltransferase [Devosia sp. BK]|uniref:glycosyltransferase family 4 protein n=1 Tax=Devosia sp. BK TaxID=2871706 RepID=UPI00293A82BD|nr:glycosyltransferase [Devosia sp. BK]MDV3253674.1 glycosyltransferase [Devosia sp. BK]